MLHELLKYRDSDYFENRNKTELFLFSTLFPILKLAEIQKSQGGYWLMYDKMIIKALTTPCISLSELAGIKIFYKNYSDIKGQIMGHTGINNSPFAYIYWTKYSSNLKDGMPCALCDFYNLELEAK